MPAGQGAVPAADTAAAWRREHGWLSVAEAAAEQGITRQALNVRINRGTQPAVRAGADTPSEEALDTPLSPPRLHDKPGPATRRSGTYRDGTPTR
jgi:hypothetical protein